MKVRLFQDAHEKKRRGTRKCPWSVEWRENGQRRTKTIGAKADAEKFATVKHAELIDGAMGIVTRKRWGDFVEEYMAHEMEGSNKRPGTIDLTRTVLATFTRTVSPTWVYLIDAKALDEFRRKRLKDPGPKGRISPETVLKELRHLHAALGVAKRWKYLREIPPIPRVATDQKEKPHVQEAHFLAMLEAADAATRPDLRIHDVAHEAGCGEWWRALLVTLWVTGARIGAVLRLRWEDMDWQTGRVLSRAADLKQRKDTRPEVAGALPLLLKIRGGDPRLLPWNHTKRVLYAQLAKIQRAAGIELPCLDEGQPGHACRESCRTYGFHAFRYAHARFNYANPELQNQMGHACAATTEHYRRWAERQMDTYGAYLPKSLEQRENAGKDDGKPELRLVAG